MSVVDLGVKGIEPDREAGTNVAEGADGDKNSGDEHEEADDQPGDAICGDIEGRNKKAEEEQRGAQIPLKNQDGYSHKPYDQDWSKVTSAGHPHAQNLGTSNREVIAVVHQVTREEDCQRDLDELAGLH